MAKAWRIATFVGAVLGCSAGNGTVQSGPVPKTDGGAVADAMQADSVAVDDAAIVDSAVAMDSATHDVPAMDAGADGASIGLDVVAADAGAGSDVPRVVDVPADTGPCVVGTTITVDNDTMGSGYREETMNWESWATDACRVTYRYLSQHVGDGTRRGRAYWEPPIRMTGFYRVTTSYRASANRSTNADYYVEDDRGMRLHTVVNQQMGTGCTHVDLGLAWCHAGGRCRALLDGNDGQSAAADETTFRIEACSGAVTVSPCVGIRANTAFEVCAETATTCSGVFTNGAGCTAYCAAAGMVCTARSGGGAGCMREAGSIACAVSNGHASDWCDCAVR